jgi:amidase
VYEYWQINKRKIAAQQAYHTMWNSMRSASGRPVDVLLAPTMPHTALPHRYTKLFNVLDYTALSFPAGKASKELDGDLPLDYAPRNAHDAWNWERYNPEEMDGHSVGLQIVGRKFEEEKVLGVARQFESLLVK